MCSNQREYIFQKEADRKYTVNTDSILLELKKAFDVTINFDYGGPL